jgi:hypothetical protein
VFAVWNKIGGFMDVKCFQTEKRFIVFDKQGRRAEITFSRRDSSERYRFEKCVFTTKSKTYDLEDWMFLGAVSKYIEGRDEHELNSD